MIDVNGKVVMISGANRGIGLAIARSLYKAGYSLSLGSRNISSLENLIENSSEDRILNCHFDAIYLTSCKNCKSRPILKRCSDAANIKMPHSNDGIMRLVNIIAPKPVKRPNKRSSSPLAAKIPVGCTSININTPATME